MNRVKPFFGQLQRPSTLTLFMNGVKTFFGQLQRPSTLTLVKPKKTGRKCLAPPQNVTVAYLAMNLRQEAAFSSALDAVNAGESSGHFSLPPCGPALPPTHMRLPCARSRLSSGGGDCK